MAAQFWIAAFNTPAHGQVPLVLPPWICACPYTPALITRHLSGRAGAHVGNLLQTPITLVARRYPHRRSCLALSFLT